MKKKIIIWGLIIALLLGAGVGAFLHFDPFNFFGTEQGQTPTTNTDATKADLEAALEYIKTVYKNPSEKTPRDFQRIGNVPVNGMNLEVVWSVDVGEEHIKIVKGEDGMVTIDVNEQSDKDVPYVLTATISNGTDSVSFSWNHLLPMVNNDMAAIVEEAYKLEVGQSMDYEVTLTGVITRVNTAYDPNYQNITVTIEVAGAEDKPIECYRLKGEGAEDLQIGDTITVTGILKNYNGKIEFDQGCVLDAVVKGEAVDAPTDIGQILKDAYALEDGKALPYVATLTGKITTINSVYNPAYGNVSVTIVVDGYPEYPILCYRIAGEGADNLLIGDTITVKGYITNYAGKIEFEQGSQLIHVEKTGTEIEAPTDVNEILNAAFGMADGESLPYKVTLTGKISKIRTPYDPGYKNVTVAMKVNGKTIECYRLAGDGAEMIGLDDTITVTGYLTNYHGTIQFAQGCVLNSWKDTGSDVPPADENISASTVVPEIVTSPKAGTAYKFYLHQKTLGKNLYLTGNMDGFYYETSDNHEDAIDVFVEEVSGGYRLYFKKGGVKNYLEIIRVLSSDGKYHNNVVFTTKPTKVLKWNDAIKSFTCDLEIDGEKCDYYFGTYSSYQTMSGSDVTRVTGENAEALDETNFVAHLVTLKETKVSAEEKAFEELKSDYPATKNPTSVSKDFTRRAYYTVEGKKVQIKWTTDNKAVKIVDNGNGTVTVKIARGDKAVDFKLTATITGDDETYTTSWDYKIPAKPSENIPELPTKDGATITIEQALTYGPDLSEYTTIKYKVTGKIVSVYSTVYGNMYIADEKGNMLTIYGTFNADGTVRYDEMEVKPVEGDTITVYGPLGQYNGAAQIKNGWIIEHIPGTGEEDNDKPEMTMQEIVDAAYKLEDGKMLPGKYTLTGMITSVDTPYSDQYGNVTVTIQVAGRENKPIKCYRLAGTGADKIDVGDTITVTGILKNYMGTIEFDQGCTLDSYVKGDPSDVPEKPTPTQPTTPSGGVLIPETVTSPKTGKAYKLYLTQKNLGKTLYLNGEMSGFYFATTENHEEAVDVYVEKVSGGYRLYFKKGGEKYYIEMARVESNGSYHNNVIFTTTPTKTLKWNADINSYTCELDVDGEKTDFYFGTYGTYSTFSASKISYVTGDKADTMDVSNFVAHLAVMKEVAVAPTEPTTPPATQPTTPTQKPTAAPTEPPAPGTPVYGLISGKPSVGVAYKWASDTGDKEGILAFIGTTANKDYYLSTSTTMTEGVDVYVETVTGGYRMYFKTGKTKTYIDIYQNGTYVNARLTDTPTAVFTWNSDFKTFVADIGGTPYYLGTYTSGSTGVTYTTLSASKLSYMNPDNVDVTQFPARFFEQTGTVAPQPTTPTQKPTTKPTAPATQPTTPPATQPTTPPATQPTEPNPDAPTFELIGQPSVGVAYKWAADTGAAKGICTFIGTTANKDYYLSTSATMSEGVDVFVEEVTGGYRMYFMDGETKTYIDIYQNGTYVNARLTTEPTAVFTWNSDFNTFVADIAGTPYYLGTYTNSSGTTFETLSASKLSYMKPENVDVTNFPCRFYAQTGAVDPQPTTPTEPTVAPTEPTQAPTEEPTQEPTQAPTEEPTVAPTEPVAPTFELIGQPSVGVAYKWAADTGAAKGICTFIGTTANKDYYLSTSATMSEGVDVFVEEVTGGYRMYFMDGETKTYIDIYQNGTYVNARLTTEPTAVFTWNSEFNTFVADIAGTPYYLGTYTNSSGTTFETLSASKLSYMKPENVDVTNFPCRFYAQTGAVDPQPTTPPATQPTTPPATQPTTPPATQPTTPTEPVPGMTMQEIVDAAYELANGSSMSEPVTLTGVITRVNTPYDSGHENVTVTITVEGREDKPIMCYRMKGEGADVIKVGDTITVTGTIKNYNGTIEFDQGCTLDSYVVGEAPEDPTEGMTMQELVDYAYQLPVGGYVDGKTLTGKIIEVNIPFSSQYNNVTVTIVVEGREDKPIECFRMKGEGADVIAVGDTITVTGSLTNYDGKIEFNSGCILDSYVKADPTPSEPTTPSEPATEPETQPSEPATEPETQPTEPVSGGSATYVMQNYKVDGELGGGTFTRDLDENVRFTISSGWFTTQARIYKTANGVITSTKDISSITLNVGGKTSTFNVYVSEDGETWTEYQMGVAYTETPYSDVTIAFNAPVKHIKFDCPNAQLRIAEITIDFAASSTEPTTPTEPTVAPTEPTQAPTEEPTQEPTQAPTEEPTVAPTEPVAPSYELISGQPSVGVAYKWAADTGNAKGILTFTGTTANKDYYLSTSTTMTEGVDVYVEEVTGGYRMYFGNEAKTYIDIYQNGTYVNARLTTEPTAVFTWNSDFNTFVTDIAGTTYYLGTYTNSSGTTFDTLSASKLSYMNAGNVDVTQFPARFYAQTGAVDPQPTTPTEPTVAPTEPTVAPTEPTQAPTEEPTVAPTEPAAESAYNKITTLDELTTGKYVMVVSNGYAPTTIGTGTSPWLNAGTPVITGDTITVDNATGFVWEITVDGTSVTLKDSNGAFIKPKAGNNNGIQSGTYNWAVSCTNGTFQFKGTGSDTTTLTFNGDSQYMKFRSYKNTTVAGNTSTYLSNFTLYKLSEGTAIEPTTPTEPTQEPTQAPTQAPTTAPTEPGTEMTMVEIVDAAYELASGSAMSESCTLTGVITRVNTPYDSGYKNVTVTITVEGREDKPIMCYRLAGDGADVIAVGDTITVTGTIKNYNGTIEFDQGCTLDSYVKGVAPEDPYAGMTMQELVDAAYALEAGKFIDGKTLTGKIIEVNTAYSDQYSNVTVTIVVEGKEDKPIECFRMKGNGADIIGVGDTITVTGNLTNYNGTKIEFDQGCMLVSYTKEQNGGELDPSDINYVYGSTSGYNNVIKNWGERGVVATGLSPNAKAFYTDNNTSYAALSALTGSSTVSSVPGSALYGELQDLMVENHTKQTSYGDTRYLYCFTDCENSDSSSISCFYSGDAIGPDWDSGSTWNREHCWPKSKTPAGDANNNSTGEVGDIMTLRPTKSNINSSRSNKAYGQSSNYYNPNGNLGSTGYDLRGDVARIVLYTYVRWGNTSYMWGTDGVMENETVLLDWIEADPVDTWELGRNDSVESITGTRNVFVDYPELAFVLFGETVPTTMQTPSKAAA